MTDFVVSARKYRPAVFEHVVGQAHITTTLKNAIKDRHLAQAFLFCGPRGVGKTTCARILAKTINCEQVTAAIEPCNTCHSCTSFNNHSSLNVYELDAASNNSVEDIRTLVEQVRYPPQTGQYKVYIIDEVHMLSNAAFNAFLKTLEEPPSYAIFILATTEKHKIIPTILSRCQIFDFHRIQPTAIVQQLKHIAAQEAIAYEEEALHLIAQKADGAMRDALSIFDLITTFAAGQPVSYAATRQHLHLLDYTYYFRLTEALLQGDAAAALLLYDEILQAGFEGEHFLTGLSEHFRNLLVSQTPASLSLVAAADNVKEQYQAQARQAGSNFLSQALRITHEFALHYKTSNNRRLHVELALIALAKQPSNQATDKPTTQAKNQPVKKSTNQQINQSTDKPTTQAKKQPIKESTNQLINQATDKPTTQAKKQPSNQATDKPTTQSKNQPINQSTNQPIKSLPATVKLPKLAELQKVASQTAPTTTTPAPEATTQPPLTIAAVQPHWQAYGQQLKEAGKMSEYSLLNQAFTIEDNHLVVKLVNAVQQDTLASVQEELVAYLRTKLQRPDVGLRGEVVQAPPNSKPYTAQEKFKYLRQKYPALGTLQEALALEVQD